MTNKENISQVPSEKYLVDEILANKKTGGLSSTKLKTDQKVLARVTDGIYRLPGSALRELISNAYDADAENVIIDTDVPRFSTITIRDDGNGMSVDTLVNLITHIGGSAKRSSKGKELLVTDAHDSSISPKKHRKLIGKIGIGLFSVAQLTRDFEIITKQKDNDYYLKARVSLHNYSEESLEDERGASFETGDVEIWTEETDNLNAHGTDIILRNIKSSAQALLKSVDIWGQKNAETITDDNIDNNLNSSRLETPKFHVGCLSSKEGYEYFNKTVNEEPSLPWSETDREDEKFSKLYNGILDLTKNTYSPKLNTVLDNYLNMVWTLALSVPLDYIDGHPFDLTLKDMPDCYSISNKRKGQVSKVELEDESLKLSEVFKLNTVTETVGFNVVVDGVKLFRPLKFTGLPESRASVKSPILFIGSYAPDLSAVDIHDSGGSLSFDAYLLWSPKVIPRDHNGVLLRLHNASGILFDETFMKHQVAELTIKSQLIVEIFVNKGLDSALNIDRESFNISHPHYQIVMRWLHQAIRQVVNKYKSIRNELQKDSRVEAISEFNENVMIPVIESLTKRRRDTYDRSPFHIVEKEHTGKQVDAFTVDLDEYKSATRSTSIISNKSKAIQIKTEALLQILDSYDLLESLSSEQQNQLIIDILRILSVEE